MQKNLFIFYSAFLLFSCSKEGSKSNQQDVLPKEVFVPLLVDLQVLESYYQIVYNRPNAYRNALDSASYFVFQKHNASRQSFEYSFSHYSQDLNELYTIYESALDSLTFRINNKAY